MPVGTVTPGNYITITPDTLTGIPASLTITPSPTMAVLSANMQALTLYALSADTWLNSVKVNLSDLASQAGTAGHGAGLVGVPQIVGTQFTSPVGTLENLLEWYADRIVDVASLMSPQAYAPGTTGGDLLCGVAAYSGSKFTIANGSLRTFLRLLADKAARVDQANTFTADQTFDTGTVERHKGTIVEQVGSFRVRDAGTIATNVNSATLDVTTAAYWKARGWTGATPGVSGTPAVLDLTLANYAGSGEPEIEILFQCGSGFYTLNVYRAGGAQIIAVDSCGGSPHTATITNAVGAALRFRWLATPTSAWTFVGGGPLSCNPSEITVLNL